MVLQRTHQAQAALLLGAGEGRMGEQVGSSLLREQLSATATGQDELQGHILEEDKEQE
jgi:hypothetical protein